jgi:hypothetical protein
MIFVLVGLKDNLFTDMVVFQMEIRGDASFNGWDG